MLSYVISLVNHYEEQFGARPNVVYMSQAHYEFLREEMPGVRAHDDVVSMIGIDISLSTEVLCPHVATAEFMEQRILVS
ncbi:MAG TPA: hypothetical protein VMV40_00375 [Acidiferrobacter sp.]|nr:hypothetical protein [Acidiferrobacter sp.]